MSDDDEGPQGGMQQLTEEDLKKMSPEQIRELQKRSCVFCQIISGKIPSKKVYDDDKVFAILDINPANPGHILLMPKEHYMILPQMPPEVTSHLFVAAKHLSMACIKALKVQGTNIFVANGAAAGQKAQHFMAHVIPRKTNDGITCFTLPRRQIAEDQLQKLTQALKTRIAQTMAKSKEGQETAMTARPQAAQQSIPAMAKTSIPSPSLPPTAQPQLSQQRTVSTAGLDLDSLTDALTGMTAQQPAEPRREPPATQQPSSREMAITVFASKQGKKFHLQNCPFLQRIAKKNRKNVAKLTETDIRQRELKPCVCVTSIMNSGKGA